MSTQYLFDNIIFIPIIAFLLSLVWKWISSKIFTWKFNFHKVLSSWGMPSTHSSLVASLTTVLWINYWFTSDMFSIAAIFSFLVMYDAMNVRYEAWMHAAAINKLTWDKLKERLWHLPWEVLVWWLLWVLVPVILHFFK